MRPSNNTLGEPPVTTSSSSGGGRSPLAASFSERRLAAKALMQSGVMLLPGAPLAIRNNDVHHEYRADSDLYYLSGFSEPEAVMVLASGPPRTEGAPSFALFVRPHDKLRETWDGKRAGLEGAQERYGADIAYPYADLQKQLPDLLEGHDRLYYHFGRYDAFDRLVIDALNVVRHRRGKIAPTQIVDSDTIVHEQRRIKRPEEIESLRRAIDITGAAHREAMRATAPGKNEYEIEALLRGVFRGRGAARVAYTPIVAGGSNATTLHYVDNERELRSGDLLLIDAGCEYEYYAADITRTFPVDGVFAGPARDLYEVVLQAQKASIAATLPGATLPEIHQKTVDTLAQGLLDLGVLLRGDGQVDNAELIKEVFMHRTSHYLGMDVHDVGRTFDGEAPRPVAPGVVITVEPGVYIAADNHAVPEAFRGIGIRIEDDVLITEGGHEILSAQIPKEIDDIEHACRG